ncbi:MAG TPA: phosphoenolpyruvate carboxykinase [Geminicoccaceae bacterium]|nr:phosphoenolpyruvate carboxykinase [Geminicoccaceae bacterium]
MLDDEVVGVDLKAAGTVRSKLGTTALVEIAIRNDEGSLAAEGAFATTTTPHTGRSPKDRFIVEQPSIRAAIDWGQVNQPLEPARSDRLWTAARTHIRGRDLFVQDLFAGADPAYRLRVRVITETAWHSLFARNMFLVPAAGDLQGFEPDFTVVQLPSLRADPKLHGTHSQAAIVVDLERRIVLICGTRYAGEIKKSIFSVLNHLLPEQGVLPMHCSANVGEGGQVAIFFGLSGTGKTTLSADPSRQLVGDDEHGWGPRGIFNFEGGCYAKVIQLSAEHEPEIYAASTRFGAILENVVVDPATGDVDLDDDSLTENTRASYPLRFIPNASETGMAGHPSHIVMLTADAFGVLPPISKLSPEQAMYHFLSGYTARVGGTEAGVKEPQATFSACFGAPFLPRKPSVYAEMLGELMRRHRVDCWLVNTGWVGGPYGTGERMSLPHTRAMLQAALDGRLGVAPMRQHPQFGLAMPTSCPGVPDEVLDPKATWADGAAYDQAARTVAERFATNFRKFEADVGDDVKAVAIRAD